MRKTWRTTAVLIGLTLLVGVGLATGAWALAPAGHEPAAGMAPQPALTRLLEGNERFTRGQSQAPDLSTSRLHELTTGQKPFAVVLTCADSRVGPEHVFNVGLGELFVIRVAGNVADSDAIASTEYAVAHLGTRLVVVLGHDSCGAVKAAVAGAKDTPAIEALVAQIAPGVDAARLEGLKDEQLLDRAVVINAQKARERMINQSALLKDLVIKGELKVVAGKYELATGQVKWLNLDGLTGASTGATPVAAEHETTSVSTARAATTQPQAASAESHTVNAEAHTAVH